MTPEARLLLRCARVDLAPEDREEIAALCRAKLDWQTVRTLADRHGLAALLQRHLGDRTTEEVPREMLAALWAHRERLERRNVAMAAELVRVCRLLAIAGVRAVPYKGPSLALAAYSDLALREFGDLDLLVPAADALAAKEALVASGYRPEFHLSPTLERSLVRSRRHYELPLRDDTRKVLVELHWRADPDIDALPLGDGNWWNGLDRVRLPDGEVPALVPEDLLLVLCLHGTKHSWSSLGWLVDVAELVRHEHRLDWEKIVEKARVLGCRRKLAVGLRLANRLLEAPVPPHILAATTDEPVIAAASAIEAAMFAVPYSSPGVLAGAHRNVALHDSALARARIVLRTLFTPSLGDWQRWPALPPSLSFLYWMLRPVRLAEKYLLRRTPPAATPRTPPPQPHSTG